jgi:hypothetical protein
MANLKILIWEHREPSGEPDVEVTIPERLAKWVPRMMRFVPRKTKDEVWGEGVDFEGIFGDLDKLIHDALQSGSPELMDVKTKGGRIRVRVEG